MASGLEIYDASSKEDHRRWLWNRLAQRTRPTNRFGLYLCGPEDRDRQVAMTKGFSNGGLVAVDISEEYISRIRRAGGRGIASDIGDVLRHWNDGPLDFVAIDSTSTIESVLRWYADGHLSGAITRRTAVYLNIQRGREKALSPYCAQMLAEGKKHRGLWAISHLVHYWMAKECGPEWDTNAGTVAHIEMFERAWSLCAPNFSRYRSSKVMMDSVVFRGWPDDTSMHSRIAKDFMPPGLGLNAKARVRLLSAAKSTIAAIGCKGHLSRNERKTRLKLAAAKALRTKELQGV